MGEVTDGPAETVRFSERGFKWFDPVLATRGYPGSVGVHESSAASHPCVWVAMDGSDHVHLTIENAARLRDQLTYLIEHHYQNEASDV